MRYLTPVCLSVALSMVLWNAGGTVALADDDRNKEVVMLDNCEPTDPGWTPTGGCKLKPKRGDVSASEFFELLFSPLYPSGAIVGHPSWRNEPSYLSIDEGRRVRVRNRGGRGHTFTEVEDFGGGFVPDLNGDLEQAPECLTGEVIVVEPGRRIQMRDLTPGLHKFQCCIHPWMRAAIRVE